MENNFRGRIHGTTFWNIAGTFEEKIPVDEYPFDPLIFIFDHPDDMAGPFNGTVGNGQISLVWEKSGATIIGRSGLGDWAVKGNSSINSN